MSCFHVSRSAVKNARHPSYDPLNTELFRPSKANIKRQQTSTSTSKVVQEFIKQRCPVKSGSARVLYKQYITNDKLYREYCDNFGAFANQIRSNLATSEPLVKVSAKTFTNIKSGMHVSVQKVYWGQFDCPICVNSNPDLIDLHNASYEHQRRYYNNLRNTLREGDIIVTQDFTEVRLQTGVGRNESRSTDSLTVMVLVLEEKMEGELKVHYIDVICDDKETKKNDWFFVHAGWRYICEQCEIFTRNVGTIFIFSDGCVQHFKNRYTLALFSEISLKYARNIRYNFFVSYHGHSIADSHAGHIKRLIEKEFLNSEYERKVMNKENWGPNNGQSVSSLLADRMKSTSVLYLDHIDRDGGKLKPNVRPLKGIKKMHLFFCNPGYPKTCFVSDLSPEDGQIVVLKKYNFDYIETVGM